MRQRLTSMVGALAAGALLLVAAPGPVQALHLLRSGPGHDPFAPLVACLALLAWTLAAWLLLATLLAGGSRWGGRGGAACEALLRRVAPATLRRALALALGAGVALGTVGVGSASASVPAAAASVGAASVGAPSVGTGALEGAAAPAAPASAAPSLDWPGTPADPLPAAGPAARHVVVRPGDTLWALAEGSLPAGATAAQVAARWPDWWATNREVIGDDPDLLHPGQSLQAPPS